VNITGTQRHQRLAPLTSRFHIRRPDEVPDHSCVHRLLCISHGNIHNIPYYRPSTPNFARSIISHRTIRTLSSHKELGISRQKRNSPCPGRRGRIEMESPRMPAHQILRQLAIILTSYLLALVPPLSKTAFLVNPRS
jgi:hypothetical protein